MGQKDDFKNFFIIRKIEEDTESKTLVEALWNNKIRILILIAFVFVLVFIYKIFFASINLSGITDKNGFFQINNGESVNYVAEELKKENLISSTFIFKAYMRFSFGEDAAQTGIYKFTKDDNLLSIVRKIKYAEYAVSPVKITIPEGSNNYEIASIINQSFTENTNSYFEHDDFSTSTVLYSIQDLQGYLFPETYLFLPNTSLDQVVSGLKDKSYDNLKELFTNLKEITKENKNTNVKLYGSDLREIDLTAYFNDKTKTINLNKKLTIVNDLGTTTLSIQNILTMASYLEGEANNDKDMKMVSGVLWTRIKIGYFLQIDAASTTYKIKGFTKSPINNPGLVAINATLNPTQTGYLYYITGRDGEMYYAKDYETHLVNIKKHLK
ncbi:MAG: endolytic transglycosylase MltG [Candidatus Nomurabacteria bacterium]